MSRLRATIARRLVEVQQSSAMLTTFNEADMDHIIRMRQQYRDEFQERHNGTRLGFMSFFVKASVEALKRFPAVNASIDGSDIVYHGYYDIGVAIGTDEDWSYRCSKMQMHLVLPKSKTRSWITATKQDPTD